MTTITLYVNHYRHADAGRQAELDECLRRNIANSEIDRIVVLGQSAARADFASPKVDWIDGDYVANPYGRPAFRDFFATVNRCVVRPDDVSVVANSDLYFDESLALLRTVSLEDVCLALTRWEVGPEGPKLEAYDNCQDSWIFQGRIRPIGWTDFPMGIFGCDNRLAWELRHADYLVQNPCYDLRSYHLHGSGVRFNGSCIPDPWDSVARKRWSECRFRAQGPSKAGVIAYSLWGADPKYNVGAIENAKLVKHLYPGWIARFYVDDTVPQETVRRLHDLHAEVVRMRTGEGSSGAFWRFLVAEERGAARWMVRDADSRLNYRERRAVDEWIASGRRFHAMKDHPNHRRPIMACGFGGVRGCLDDMASRIARWPRKSDYGDDEEFLAEAVWETIKHDALVHDAFAERYDETTRPFPTEREFARFVGERCFQDEHWAHADRDSLWAGEETEALRETPCEGNATDEAPEMSRGE